MARNPLTTYRKIQLEIRAEFEPFNKSHCSCCPAPCCRKPARIGPNDILLAQAAGWKPPINFLGDPVEAISSTMIHDMNDEGGDGAPPCDFLGSTGCSFPQDLRPFGCTTYVCEYMYRDMAPKQLARLKRLIRELRDAHELLESALSRTISLERRSSN